MTAAQIKSVRSEAARKAWQTMRKKGWKPNRVKKDVTQLESSYKKAQKNVEKKITLPKKAAPPSIAEIAARTMALVLNFHGIGNRRKVASEQFEVGEADKSLLSMSKKLIDAEELEAVTSKDGEIRRYIELKAVPGSMLKKGIYIMPSESMETVDRDLTNFEIERRALVESLAKVYTHRVSEAKARHKNLFNENDYLSLTELREAFQLTWSWKWFTTPASIEQINREIYAREQAKAEAHWRQACEVADEVLTANLNELVTHLVDRLTPSGDGKQKVFRDSAITNLRDWTDAFNPRNIGNNVQLKALVDRAKSLLNGIDPELLRTSEDTREYVKHGFAQIKNVLDPMIVDKPRRRISLEDI